MEIDEDEFNGIDPETGIEARSDDEGDTGEDLKDFIVEDEDEEDDPEPEKEDEDAPPPPTLIVEGKRNRRPPKRYIDEIAHEVQALYEEEEDEDEETETEEEEPEPETEDEDWQEEDESGTETEMEEEPEPRSPAKTEES